MTQLSRSIINSFRRCRVLSKLALRVEPFVPIRVQAALEFHGHDDCGWCVPTQCLKQGSVVVDVGLGEDISFSTSLISRYGCEVHGFDPTPRAIEFVERSAPSGFVLHPVGVAAERGSATFYLPNNEEHVSGSLVSAEHLGLRSIKVELVTLGDVFERIGRPFIDLLKIDIEGAEYSLLASEDFALHSKDIGMLCVEFHHRWENYGSIATLNAVKRLSDLGFECAWRSPTSNEEYLFVRNDP
jgi:FkbM family methyltransferase